MSLTLRIAATIFLLTVILIILYLVKKEKIAIKYSFVWLIPFALLLVFILIPVFLNWTTNLLGFQTASNMILTLLVCLLLIISIALTVIVSTQKEQIRLLIQELSLLKEKK